jgi:hypothetical protein
MKRNAEGEAHIVYGYLRAKDSGTGKAGSPYYVGIGNSHTRAFQQHTRGGKSSKMHNVPVPKNEALVRQFGVFKTRAEAAAREQALIAQYGRKGLDPGGTLLNRTLGGEGALGSKRTAAQKRRIGDSSRGRQWTAEQKARHAAAQQGVKRTTRTANVAAKLGVDPDFYSNATPAERRLIRERISSGVSPVEAVKNLDRAGKGPGYRAQQDAAKRYGISIEKMQSLDYNQRQLANNRYNQGLRGDALFAPPEKKGTLSANTEQHLIDKYQIPLAEWLQLSRRQRVVVAVRYQRGGRGDDLWGGLKEGINQSTWRLARKLEIDPVLFASLPQKTKDALASKFKYSKGALRGAALLEGLI